MYVYFISAMIQFFIIKLNSHFRLYYITKLYCKYEICTTSFELYSLKVDI